MRAVPCGDGFIRGDRNLTTGLDGWTECHGPVNGPRSVILSTRRLSHEQHADRRRSSSAPHRRPSRNTWIPSAAASMLLLGLLRVKNVMRHCAATLSENRCYFLRKRRTVPAPTLGDSVTSGGLTYTIRVRSAGLLDSGDEVRGYLAGWPVTEEAQVAREAPEVDAVRYARLELLLRSFMVRPWTSQPRGNWFRC